jgi:hypothetical protein
MLEKIISGGQTGVDLGALEGARDCGIPTGGTAPPNWMSGGRPEPNLLQSFGLQKLKEWDPKIYPKRSMKNVDDADATIAIVWGFSVGTQKTIGYCQTGEWKYPMTESRRKFVTPCCQIFTEDLNTAAFAIECFIQENDYRVLNFAGHREQTHPGIQAWTRQLIHLVYERLNIQL